MLCGIRSREAYGVRRLAGAFDRAKALAPVEKREQAPGTPYASRISKPRWPAADVDCRFVFGSLAWHGETLG
jgi:hypothetical protein